MKSHSLKPALLALWVFTQMVYTPVVKADNDTDRAPGDIAKLISKDASWSLRFPKDDLVVYKGTMNFDKLGTDSTGIMYAGGAIGLAAGLITFGLINDSAKTRQRNKAEEAADKVLVPYQSILTDFHQKQLMQSGLERVNLTDKKRMVEFGEKSVADWILESSPVFSMTQDQKAIILENTIAIYMQKNPSAPPVYQNTFKVISQAKDEDNLVNFWTADQGAKLKEESANLFGYSLNMILSEVAVDSSKNNNPHKMFRYIEGSNEKMERGQLVSEQCNRVVIKTLRGELMSIPLKRLTTTDALANHCI